MVTKAQVKTRANEIAGAKHPAPKSPTARDRGYILALYKEFGANEIPLARLMETTFPADVAQDFGILSSRYDDRAVLGVRLPHFDWLRAERNGLSFRLTENGISLARQLASES